MLPATGWVTARAKAVATAASTAFPPSWSAREPTSEASAFCETTMPRRARTTWAGPASAGTVRKQANSSRAAPFRFKLASRADGRSGRTPDRGRGYHEAGLDYDCGQGNQGHGRAGGRDGPTRVAALGPCRTLRPGLLRLGSARPSLRGATRLRLRALAPRGPDPGRGAPSRPRRVARDLGDRPARGQL